MQSLGQDNSEDKTKSPDLDFQEVEKKCPYTRAQIAEMRRKKMKKPDDCPVADWTAPLTFRNHHYAIAYMHVMGMKNSEIAKELNLNANNIGKLLNSDRMRELCAKVRFKYFVVDTKKRLDMVLPKAIDVAEEIMLNKKVKPSTRADTAFRFMDRSLGKPVQQFEVGGNVVKQLLDRLIEKETPKVLDVKTIEANNEIKEAEFRDITEVKQEPITDEIDEWVNKNIK